MPTSRADRLDKLFQRDSLPPHPDPNQPHIADTEMISKIQPPQASREVPTMAQKPNKVTKPPPPTGRDIDQLTSSDDDEYLRAFKKTPVIKPETVKKGGKKTSRSSDHGKKEKAHAKVRPQTARASEGRKVNQNRGNSMPNVEGDGYPPIGRFCIFTLITKFCYKYMDDPNDRVSKHFFASGKIWNRTWDIYYIHPPASLFTKPLLLVPETQVQNLLDEINSAFKISIKLPPDPFLLTFHQDGTPAPVLLGTSQSREAVGEMQQKIPTPSEDHGECPTDASPELERCFERFKLKLERASAEVKRKGAAMKKAKAKNRLAAHVNSCDALKRGQRYLGLRPLDRKGGLPLPDSSLSWDEQQSLEREQKIKYGHILQPLDVEKPAPHLFDRDVIFISVDVESYERNHDRITEVGISTLDTTDIKSITPGHGGFNWMKCIRSRHFRISDHVHLRNTTFCTGNPEKFLFGHSEFVSMNEIGRAVDLCFEPPYSAEFMHKGESRAQDNNNNNNNNSGLGKKTWNDLFPEAVKDEQPQHLMQSRVENAPGLSKEEQGQADKLAVSNILPSFELLGQADFEKGCLAASKSNNGEAADVPPTKSPQYQSDQPKHRNIIFVGHDLDGDLQYLSTLKSKIFQKDSPAVNPQSVESQHPSRTPILESLDTANLYQVWKREANITSLAKVLVGVERTGWHLHNGGNDARYTLEALIGILLGARVEDGMKTKTDEAEQEQQLERRIRDKQDAVEKEERENVAMWKHAMGDNVDDEDGAVLLDPYMPPPAPSPTEQKENHASSAPSQREADAHHPNSRNHSAAASTQENSEAQPYSWSSFPRATLDGGEPKPFQMLSPKREKAKPSSSRRERDEVLKLQEEGEIGKPCDWGVGGEDGW